MIGLPVLLKFTLPLVCILSLIQAVYAGEKTLEEFSLESQGKILFLRHAIAPGHGDPHNFILGDCSTQRNLDQSGQSQATKLGARIQLTGIIFKKIYSSEWCRCYETADLLNLGPVVLHSGLNSFYQGIVSKRETLSLLKKFIKQLSPSDLPLIMVTHFVTINAITGLSVSSGGGVAYDVESGEVDRIAIDY